MTVTKHKALEQSPLRLLLIMAVSIFVAEALVIFLLSVLPPLPVAAQALLDSALLVALLVPSLYLFMFRPLRRHISELGQAQKALQEAHAEAESRVRERTSELEQANTALHAEIAERQRAEQESRLLQTIALAIGEAEDLHLALEVLLQKVCQATGWALGEAWVPGVNGASLERSPAWHGSIPGLETFREASAGFTFPPGVGLPGRVWAVKRAAWIRDVTVDENFPRAALAAEAGLKAAFGIPILAGDEVVAVADFFTLEPRDEDERLVGLVSAVAAQLGAVVQRKQTEQRLRAAETRRAQEAETLRQAGAVVAAALRQDEAIERILQQLERVVPYDSASVLLLRQGFLEIVGGRGWKDPAAVVGLRFPLPGDNPNTLVIQQRRPHILKDAPAEYAAFRAAPHRHIRSWLGVPLIVGEQVIGMLAVDHAQPDFFTPDHVRLAAAFADQVSIVIENARLFTEIEQKASELGRLYEAAQDMTSSLDPHVVLERLACHLTQALEATSGYINAVDVERDAITVLAEYWSEQAVPAERTSDLGRNYPLHEYPLTLRAIGEGKAITCTAESDHLSSAEREELLNHAVQSQILIPIITRGQSIGVAQIWDSRRKRDFSEAERRLAQTLAQHGAAVIQNVRLYAETEKHAEQLRALRAAGHALASDLQLDAVLSTLAETARHLTGASYVALAVSDEKGSLSQFHTAGLTEAARKKIGELPTGRGLLGEVLRGGAPIRIDDLTRDPRFSGFPPRHPKMKTFLGVPIMARGQVVGSLYMTDKRSGDPFTQEDETLATGLAADAAIAIENARLFSQVQQLAITDGLTGLHNHRHFLELAKREFERARRYGHPLSAVFLDLDHFKQVNDAFGHAVGDQVLREVAARCRDGLREIDILARYGGEEFVALLPETALDGGREAAERLRCCVANPPIETERGEIAITISAGVAALGGGCPDLEGLLGCADQALYDAKQTGRNRVCVWRERDSSYSAGVK